MRAREWQRAQIIHAFSKGFAKHARNETRAVFEGDAYSIPTFQGEHWAAMGKLHFLHHEAKVLEVDFDHDLVTDFGYSGYSMTTTRHISGWTSVLHHMRFIDMPSLDSQRWPFDWTQSYVFNPTPRIKGEGYHEKMRDRFRAQVPWVKWIDGMPWFHGGGWDVDLHLRYEELRRILLSDKNHCWWTGDWDKYGRWSKRFIDADAERRWNALQKRRQRAQARWDKATV